MEPYLVNLDECVRLEPFPGVVMRAMAAERMTLSLVEMEPGSLIAQHAHPHEQIGFMIEGEAEFVIGDQTFRVKAGQMWRIPGGLRHKIQALSRVVALDAFCPRREDMTQPNSWGRISLADQ